MKIGFDAKRLFHNYTGLGNYSRTLVRNVQRFYPQHEYHLFTPDIVQTDETQYFLDHTKFVIHTADTSLKSWWRSMGMADDIVDSGVDIYHGLSHEIPFSLPGKSVVSLVSIHDLIYKKYPKQYGLWDRFAYDFKYRFSARAADHVLAISESTKNDLVKLYNIGADRISVIYQSCGDSFQNCPKGITENTPSYFLYVGSIIERKGLMQIVKAYAKLDESLQIPFKVVGQGKAYLEKVLRLLADLGLESKFEFISSVANDKLIALYKDATALVLPSIYEGFGIPIIESLFAGTPVIISKTSALPEAAGLGGILVNPFDLDQLSDAMKAIILDPKLRKRLVEKGQNHVQENFSASTTAKELMHLYEKLVENKFQKL